MNDQRRDEVTKRGAQGMCHDGGLSPPQCASMIGRLAARCERIPRKGATVERGNEAGA